MVYEEAPSPSSILHLAPEPYTTQASLGSSHLEDTVDSLRRASTAKAHVPDLRERTVLTSEPGNPGPQHACGMVD